MSYPQAVRYLESLVNYEKFSSYPYQEALRLERINGLLGLIGNPQQGLKAIHVAGTKGKGSTCAFLTYILREAGFKVGLYTSPHLKDFRERIRVLAAIKNKPDPGDIFEGLIPRSSLARLVARLKPVIEKYNRFSHFGPLTFFEVYTALAFLYFKEKGVDIAVLETGLGGRLDATNAVSSLVSVITPLSYEHMDKLGTTLSKIAAEKAGIIKGRELAVVSAPQRKEALLAIRDRCRKKGVRLFVVGKDIKYSGSNANFKIVTPGSEYKGLKIRLIGAHQLMNAACAIAALELGGIKPGIASIKRGLYNSLWPARCEVIAREPLIVLDGAQNAASAEALKKTIKNNFRYKRLILILGVSSDKDIKGIAAELKGMASAVILTKARSLRAMPPEMMKKYFPGKDVYLTASVKKAKMLGEHLAAKDDLVLVTGSLFVAGEYRDAKK